jgi:hypothetical protein
MQLARIQTTLLKPRAVGKKEYMQLLQLLLQGFLDQVAVAGARECSSVLWACAKLSSPPSRKEVGVVWERFCEVVVEGRVLLGVEGGQQLLEEGRVVEEGYQGRGNGMGFCSSSNYGSSYGSGKEWGGDAESSAIASKAESRNKDGSSTSSSRGRSSAGRGFTGEKVSGKGFTAQDLSLAFWAVATLQWQITGEQLDTLLAVAADFEILATAPPQAVANILWAVATLQHRPSSSVMLQLESRAVEVLPKLNQQGLHNVLWGMTKLMWTPGQGFQSSFLGEVRGKLRGMSPHASSGILWSWATLGLGMPEEWLREWHVATLPKMVPGRRSVEQQRQQQVEQQEQQGAAIHARKGTAHSQHQQQQQVQEQQQQGGEGYGSKDATCPQKQEQRQQEQQQQGGAVHAQKNTVITRQQQQQQQQRQQGGAVQGDKDAAITQQQQQQQQQEQRQQGGAVQGDKDAAITQQQQHQQQRGAVNAIKDTAHPQPQQQHQHPAFGPQDFGNALWAHGHRGWQPSDTWMSGFWEGSKGQLERAGVKELASMMWGAARLGRMPEREWVRVWLRCMGREMDR